MTPILGITASSITPFTLGDFESIATVTVTGATAASVEFTNIPSTYKHLQIRMLARTDRAVTGTNLVFYLNNDTGSNYAWHYLTGDGSSAAAGAQANSNGPYIMKVSGASATSNRFGVGVLDILDYTNTNKNKTVRALSGYDNNGSGEVALFSAVWLSTSAVTSFKIDDVISASNFVTNTTFALYGIKG